MEEGVFDSPARIHRTSGVNEQSVNIGDIVQIHDDVPRIQWKLRVIEGLNRGNDGYIRSVTVCTANGRTNRPIAHLYPLEVSTDQCPMNETSKDFGQQATEQQQDTCTNQDVTASQRPIQRAMMRARDQVTEWTRMLRCPPEDVEDN